jgi:hypothetical protein
MIAITIATIGLLIKSLEIIYKVLAFNGSSLARAVCERLRRDSDTRSDFLRTFCNHILIWFETILDDPHVVDTISDSHRTYLNLVIRANNRNLVDTLEFANCALWNE